MEVKAKKAAFNPFGYEFESYSMDFKIQKKKVPRMAPRRETLDYYTDILAHQFNPLDNKQVIVGTTFGDIAIIE